MCNGMPSSEIYSIRNLLTIHNFPVIIFSVNNSLKAPSIIAIRSDDSRTIGSVQSTILIMKSYNAILSYSHSVHSVHNRSSLMFKVSWNSQCANNLWVPSLGHLTRKFAIVNVQIILSELPRELNCFPILVSVLCNTSEQSPEFSVQCFNCVEQNGR